MFNRLNLLATGWLIVVGGCATAASVPAARYDVVVYGSTPGGITAAIAAARQGASAVIISPMKHIGGMVTGGLSSTDVGRPEVIGGLALEFFERAAAYYHDPDKLKGRDKFFSEPRIAEAAFEAMLTEAKVPVIRGQRLELKNGVKIENGRIASITMESGELYAGKMFVDATYEGDLMAKAGVKYIVGREARSAYGESLAGFYPDPLRPRTTEHMAKPGSAYVHGTPAKISAYDASGKLLWGINDKWLEPGDGDGRTQAYNFRVIATQRKENMVAFPRPANYEPRRYELLLRIIQKFPGVRFEKLVFTGKIPGDKYDLNAVGLVMGTDHPGFNTAYPDGDYAMRQRIWQDHIDYVQGFLYFLGNDPRVPEDLREQTRSWGLAHDEFSDNRHWPYQLYVREARRMIGAYVVSQKDLVQEITKPDSIAMGSFIMDSHCVQRLVDKEGNVIDEGNFDMPVRPYHIPYRSIIPAKGQRANLLVPVCMSATHVAYGSIRMEPQYMCLGHASGLAAALAIKANCSVQDVDVKQLQAMLREQKAVLEVSKEVLQGSGPDSKDLPGIVMDDVMATFTGQWVGSTFGSSVNGSFRHDGNEEKGNKTARYEIKVPADGVYEVRLSTSLATNRATNTPVTVRCADGEKTIKVNQRQAPEDGKLFTSVGTFRFSAGEPAIVTISNKDTDGYVVADAVQLIAVKK